MYVFMLSSLLRKAVEISHTHRKLYACAGLDFVSCHKPTKWLQSSCWQPQPPQKVATSIYCIIIQPFSSHLFLAHIRLIWPVCPKNVMMWSKLSGGGRDSQVYWNRSHHCQEEDEMAKAGVLAFLLAIWLEKGQTKWSLSVHHKTWSTTQILSSLTV